MGHRLERIQSQLQNILGRILLQYRSDFGIGLLSINDIVVSRDLSKAKVWVSLIGKGSQVGEFKKLLKNKNNIQSIIYKELAIKKVPQIEWCLDKDPSRAERIEGILNDIKRNQAKDFGDKAEGPGS